MIRSSSARSSGSCPMMFGFRSFGCTSRSVRATFRSPQSTTAVGPPACAACAYSSIASRNLIFAGKSLPPFGTYTDATVSSGRDRATTMRFSKSKPGCEKAGRSGNVALRTCSPTPE